MNRSGERATAGVCIAPVARALTLFASTALVAVFAACSRREPPPPSVEAVSSTRHAPVLPPLGADRFSREGMLLEAAYFLEDPTFRRRAVEESFESPSNAYSQFRLGNYALGDRGWDLLPEWNPVSVPLTEELATRFARGESPSMPTGTHAIYDGHRPQTMDQWVALGRAAFFGFPMRAEIFLKYAVERPELARKMGVLRAPDGAVPGGIVFSELDGRAAVGRTCANAVSETSPDQPATTTKEQREIVMTKNERSYENDDEPTHTVRPSNPVRSTVRQTWRLKPEYICAVTRGPSTVTTA